MAKNEATANDTSSDESNSNVGGAAGSANSSNNIRLYMSLLNTIKKSASYRSGDAAVPSSTGVYGDMPLAHDLYKYMQQVFRLSSDEHDKLCAMIVVGDGKVGLVVLLLFCCCFSSKKMCPAKYSLWPARCLSR